MVCRSVEKKQKCKTYCTCLILCHTRRDRNIRPVNKLSDQMLAICLQQDANNLHVVQLMPLPPHHLLLH